MNSRDIGLTYGAGKGDVPRSKYDARWVAKFSEINWGDPAKRDEGFTETKKGRKVKHYGNT
jgi:hypothetical protein